MRHRMKKGIFTFLIVLVVLCMAVPAISGSYSEDDMRLLRCDGSVEIVDTSGIPSTVTDDFTLSSGTTLFTGEDSRASVSLGKAKRVNVDENTTVRFCKSDKDIELTLTEGTLLLNVSEKLAANESLRIKTPHMTANIRGTIVFVSVLPANELETAYGLSAANTAGPDDRVTVLGVLEGQAEVTYTDKGGDRSLMLDAGKTAVISPAHDEIVGIVDITKDNITSFIQEQIKDDDIANRVRIECPQLFENQEIEIQEIENQAFSMDGDWVFTEKVTLVAQSASKLYDGAPLTRTGDILVYGLPEIFDINAQATGSITTAGTVENPIGPYAIFNQAGENVTSHFTNIEVVSGRLVVDPIPMTIWTGSATKVYDGTPLANEEAGFDLISGNGGDNPWRNTSLALSDAAGETLYGLSGKSLVHGTNPLTGDTRQIYLQAGEKMTVQLYDANSADSIEFKVEKISEEEIPEEILRLYAYNTALLEQACKDAGWDETKVLEYIGELSQYSGPTTTKDGLIISVSSAGGLMRELTNVRINVDADITDYSDRALNGKEAHFAEVRIDSTVKVTATGSQTEVGESENTYEIDWGNENPNNFIISEDMGVLTVDPLEIGVSWGETSAVYNGSPYVPNPTLTYLNGEHAGETVSGTRLLKNTFRFVVFTGDTIQLTVSGFGSNAGTYTINSAVSSSSSMENFSVSGADEYTLTIEPAPLTVATGSASKLYDGTPLTASEVTVTGLQGGDSITVTATGSLTEVGTAENTYSIDWGDVNPDNYSLTENLGTLTVEPNADVITLTAGSAERIYDGSALTTDEYSIEGNLPDGVEVSATVGGSQRDAGSSESTITSYTFTANGEDVTASYTNVALINGTLTVTPAELNISTGSASKGFDGAPLSAKEVTVTGLQGEDSITVTATGSLTEVGTAENTYSIDWGDVNPDNYLLTENLGTLAIEPNTGAITLTAGSVEKVYDGSDLTTEDYTLEGELPYGVEVSATIGGSRRDAGVGESSITSYTFTANGEDATAFFTNVTTANGTLTVTTADLSISTGSASKEYDGAPLTAKEVTVTGLQGGDSITVTATGSLTNVGTAENTYSIDWGDVNPDNYTIRENLGALAVEPNTGAITLTAGSVEKVYDGSDLTTEDYTLEGELPYGAEVSVTVGGSRRDAGSSESIITSYAFTANGEDVTAYFTNVDTVSGTLTVTPADLTISTGSASKPYDGSALTCAEAEIIGLAEADQGKVTVTATGSQTEIGQSANGYSIDWGNVNSSNYTITEELGTLEVTEPEAVITEITVTTGSASKVFDGTELTCAEASVSGLKEADEGKVTVTATGSITNAGSTTNGYTIDWGDVDPNQYTITESLGTLTVDTLQLNIAIGTASMTYCGSLPASSVPFVPITVTVGNGTHAGETINYSGRQYNTSDNNNVYADICFYQFPEGNGFALLISGFSEQAGSHPLAGSFLGSDSFESTLLSNYTVSIAPGTFTVNPVKVTVTTGSASKPHDGSALTCAEAKITGLVTADKDKVTVTATGSQTDVGSTENTYSIDWGGVNPGNYTITEALGTLEVTEPEPTVTEITITTGSANKVYDGTELTCAEASVSGLKEADEGKVTVTATGSITNEGSTTNSYTIDWGDVDKSQYTITESLGTLTVDTLKLRIVIGNVSTTYSGSLPVSSIYYPDITMTVENGGSKGETIGYSSRQFTASGDSISNAVYFFGFPEGDEFSLNVAGFSPQVGSHTLTGTIGKSSSAPSTQLWNYDFAISDGTFTVNPIQITVTTGSASKVYDGSALTCAEAAITGLLDADKAAVTVTATGSQTNAGSSKNTYSIDWGDVDSSNYTIVENLGTLSVTNPGGSDDPENPEIPDDGTITLNPNTNQLTYTNTNGKTTYKILDFNNCSKYITNNQGKMSSGEIVAGLISHGYIGS